MDSHGPGFPGDRELCMPAFADSPGVLGSSDVAYVEIVARKLADLGLLDPDCPALGTTKKHGIPLPPLLARPPTLSAVHLSTPFEGFCPENGEVERASGFSGSGVVSTLVGRYAGVEQRPGPTFGGAYEGSMQIRSHGGVKLMPAASQVSGDPRLAHTPKRRVPSKPSAPPTKFVGSPRRRTGTGVFLPRVLGHDYKFSRGSGDGVFDIRRRLQHERQALSANTVAVDNRRGTSCHSRPSTPVELLLPRDWTY